MVNPEDIRKLSRLAFVLVLIAKTCVEDRDPPKVTIQKSTRDGGNRDVLVPLYQSAKKFKTADSTDEFTFGEVRVNFPEMLAYRNYESVGLTHIEFKTLKYLIKNAKRVISRDELLNEVWGYENYPCTRTVDNHILRLRQKLERDPSRPIHFQTVHGAGYKFVP
jgi:DNA-binding response OmpR family regulator